MIPLPTEYKKNGYTHKQVRRSGDVVIYQLFNEKDEPRGFEVYEVRKYTERQINDVIIPAKEAPPSNEMFGHNAYAPANIERAEELMGEIQARIDKRIVK